VRYEITDPAEFEHVLEYDVKQKTWYGHDNVRPTIPLSLFLKMMVANAPLTIEGFTCIKLTD
jgi:hypothetical protein